MSVEVLAWSHYMGHANHAIIEREGGVPGPACGVKQPEGTAWRDEPRLVNKNIDTRCANCQRIIHKLMTAPTFRERAPRGAVLQTLYTYVGWSKPWFGLAHHLLLIDTNYRLRTACGTAFFSSEVKTSRDPYSYICQACTRTKAYRIGNVEVK